MTTFNPPHSFSISSYSKWHWEYILKDTAYRGLNIHKIATRLENAQECTFDDDRLIHLITSKGKTITVDMYEVFKNRGRWTLSRLVHDIRMLFPQTEYAKRFDTRIAKLAERLALDARPKHFHKRCQENLGDLAILPSELRDKIIYSMPLNSEKNIRICMDYMKMFWKAPLGEVAIFRTSVSKHGTVDAKKLASWLNHWNDLDLFDLPFLDKDPKPMFPYLEKLFATANYFNLTNFALIGTCKNLKYLSISSSKDFMDSHCLYLARLSKLVSLCILDCRNFSNAGLKQLSGLNKLTELTLRNCRVTGEGLRYIEKLSNLKMLTLEDCNLTEDDALEHLLPLTNLQHLILGEANFTREGYKRLEKLGSLKTIKITHGSFRDEDLETIGKMTNLTKISILNLYLTGSGLQYLSNLNEPLNLNLSYCKNITDENFQYILQIKNLRFIDVRNCGAITEKTLSNVPKHIKIETHYPNLQRV